VRAYIIRRLLLMVPTLFGVTLVTFVVMQFAPGDPLKMQLGQGGSQGESGATREAFLLQRRQWKLDKPAMFNRRWFADYSAEARSCARIQGLPDDAIRGLLDRLASAPDPILAFLRGLGIEGFDAQLADPTRRPELVPRVKIGVQVLIEETIAEHGIKYFVGLLDDPDLSIRIGAIRSLSLSTLGDPFIYTYSKEPESEETEKVLWNPATVPRQPLHAFEWVTKTSWKKFWLGDAGEWRRIETATPAYKAEMEKAIQVYNLQNQHPTF